MVNHQKAGEQEEYYQLWSNQGSNTVRIDAHQSEHGPGTDFQNTRVNFRSQLWKELGPLKRIVYDNLFLSGKFDSRFACICQIPPGGQIKGLKQMPKLLLIQIFENYHDLND